MLVCETATVPGDKGILPVHEMCSWLIFQELKYHPGCPPPGRTFVSVYPYFSAFLDIQTFLGPSFHSLQGDGPVIRMGEALELVCVLCSKPPFSIDNYPIDAEGNNTKTGAQW